MSKIKNISGFPEWLPEEKILEDEMIEEVLNILKSYGFVPIETPAVELLSTLTSKGVIDKEIYALKRAKDDSGEEKEKLALHFDLTVPFTRYVAQHFSSLIFPFRRYQIQKSWRGDRPQKGRFREFYQIDIDTIDRDNLSLSADAEILMVFKEVFDALNLGNYTIYLSNRKLLLGLLEAHGVSEDQGKEAVIVIDKLKKIGKEGVSTELIEKCGVASKEADKIIESLAVSCKPIDLSQFNFDNELAKEGLTELQTLFSYIPEDYYERMLIEFNLARGLDYYTGLIFEIHLDDYPEFGSCCGGGRYDDLASQFISKKLPGVGASLGFTRLMDLTLRNKLREPSKKSFSKVLVAVYNEDQRPYCNEIAMKLRSFGVRAEVFLKSPKLGKQIEYADKKDIQYVLFVDDETKNIQIKDLRTKEQTEVSDLKVWSADIVS